jgi:hypothetical protein
VTRRARLEVEGIEFIGPDLTLLALFKMKAAWDRSYRLETGSSPDPAYERTKLVKDRADVLALLDAGRGPLDARFAKATLDRFSFLVQVIDDTRADGDAHEFYGIGSDEAAGIIDTLKQALGLER